MHTPSNQHEQKTPQMSAHEPDGVSANTCAGESAPAVLLFALVLVVVLVADLGSKWLAFEYVAGTPIVNVHEAASDPDFWEQYAHEPITVVPYVLDLQLTTNTGAVFGIGKGLRWVFVMVSVLAVLLICYIFWRCHAKAYLLHIALAMILAGALGNLYDRWLYGSVRDMLWLFPTTDLWPYIFNIADVSLVLGVTLVMLLTFFPSLMPQVDETSTH